MVIGSCSLENTSVEKNTLTFDTIPAMEFYSPEGQKFKTTDLQPGKPVVFFFFSPECPHCKRNTEMMLQEIDKLREVQLFFVSPDLPERVLEYSREYNLADYKEIMLLLDTNFEFDNKYMPTVTPIYYIYGSDLLYRGTITGKTTSGQILKMARKK